MNRAEMLNRVAKRRDPWDMVIVGGGATGAGIAVDAASRGYDVLLLEQHDFGKGTSSRSTKLVHGGVRYLEQGNISLVMEALKERGLMRQNAPHLVGDLAFVVPNYDWWEAPFYGIGLKVYDLLAGALARRALHDRADDDLDDASPDGEDDRAEHEPQRPSGPGRHAWSRWRSRALPGGARTREGMETLPGFPYQRFPSPWDR